MSMLRSDLRFGCPFYVPVWKWEETRVPESITDIYCISAAISHGMEQADVDDFTGHIYVTVESLNSQGQKQTQIADIGFDEDQVANDFITLFEERLVMSPYYDNTDGIKHSYTKLKNIAETVFNLNKYKYLKILETLGYVYSPIDDYNLVETSGDAEKEGQLAATKTIRGDKVTTETAPETKTSNYTTTYDDNSVGRLKDYSVDEYQGTYPIDEDDVPIKKTVERYISDDPEVQPGETVITNHESDVSLTMDPITTPNAHKAKVHKLIRRGKIGGTSIQELIEKQRELVKISLEDEIIADLEKALLLNVWG